MTGIQISGQVVSFNRGAGFIQFPHEGKAEVCLFRPNRLYVDGEKIPAGKIKTLEGIGKYLSIGDPLSAEVRRATDLKEYTVLDGEGKSISLTPTWYSSYAWKGAAPQLSQTQDNLNEDMLDSEAGSGTSKDLIIDNVPGRIIVNQLATGTGRRSVGQTLISFKNPEGEQDIAMFRFPKLFFMNGKRIQPKEYNKWDRDYEIDVKFTAVYTPGMKEFSLKSEDKKAEMNGETVFKPNWRARLVWVGEKPTEEMIQEEEEARNRGKTSQTVLDAINGCDYMTTRVEKILNKNQGILTSRKSHILFHIENLSIDGTQYTTQENLLDILQPGETLFAYAKAVSPPYKLEDFDITHEAVQVWRGRKNIVVKPLTGENEKDRKTKSQIPLPSEATHTDIIGTVVEIETPGLGYLIIKCDDPSLRGQKVLFSRNRLYINENKLKFKQSLNDHLNIGDVLHFDMVQANPDQSMSTYNWIAVLAWQGPTPNRDEINAELCKKTESYRGKVLLLSESKDSGYTDGVVQIIGGPNKIGEKVVFSRVCTFIHGTCMKNADLAYVLKINDKVQLELNELTTSSEQYHSVVNKYQSEIRYSASTVWVGNFPRGDENYDDAVFTSTVVTPFVQKRGLTLDMFLALARGELPPKNSKLSPAGDDKTIGLPPNVTYGKVVELKRRELPSSLQNPGVQDGIVRIDNGPFAKEKAFFHRSSLFCWGFNCSKADLMYLINENDIVRLEVQGGTNNKAVPCKVTSAWIGPHKSEKNKESVAMAGNPVFMKWLADHSLNIDEFHKVIKGEMNAKPFFPFASEPHQSRLANLLYSAKGEADAGILRLCQNSANSKDGRKAPEVLFERESFYLWNVSHEKGDLSYVMNENDKYFVEVTDLIGKEKRKWQSRLGAENIPKFIATLVYVGGGRPKAERINDDIASNSNLEQWLKKRNIELGMFERLVKGKMPPRKEQGDDVFSRAYPVGAGKEQSPFNNPSISNNMNRHKSFNQAVSNEFRAGILNKAMGLTQRTMTLHTPEDPGVRNLIQDDSEAQLALFLSKTLTNAVMMYRQGGPGPICPPGNPGPIGPPRSHGPGRGRNELNEFYADSGMSRGGMSSRSEGLYGLAKPLLDYQANGSMEPPYKRKYEDW